MSQSTPLNQLPRENMNNSQNQSSSDMVDDILNEMSSHDDMSSDSFNHAMDSSQVPPEKMQENFLNKLAKPNPKIQETIILPISFFNKLLICIFFINI